MTALLYLASIDLHSLSVAGIWRSLEGLAAGLVVAAVFYAWVKSRSENISLKEMLLVGGTAALIEDALLELLDLRIAYFNVAQFFNIRIFNGIIAALLGLLIYYHLKKSSSKK